MEKKRLILIGLIVVILGVISFMFDAQISVFVASFRGINLDYFFNSFTYISNVYIVFFFLTSLFLWSEHKRRWILPLWLTSFFAVVVAYLMKIAIHRLRPFQQGIVSVFSMTQYFMKEKYLIWDFSFPSFHALLVFSALPILNKEFPKFKYVWFSYACFVALSRIYFGVHFMSDVIFGAIIGYAIGLGFVELEEKFGIGKMFIKKLGFGN